MCGGEKSTAFQSLCLTRFLSARALFLHRNHIAEHIAELRRGSRFVLANGAQSVMPLTTEPWGQRTSYVADSDGNLIEIGSFTPRTPLTANNSRTA
ncbi:MAG: hypothetical protein II811_08665 [Spirochaetaceae bacterium]|nr:hypothetical protein [Spirochaetaceae bacterium]